MGARATGGDEIACACRLQYAAQNGSGQLDSPNAAQTMWVLDPTMPCLGANGLNDCHVCAGTAGFTMGRGRALTPPGGSPGPAALQPSTPGASSHAAAPAEASRVQPGPQAAAGTGGSPRAEGASASYRLAAGSSSGPGGRIDDDAVYCSLLSNQDRQFVLYGRNAAAPTGVAAGRRGGGRGSGGPRGAGRDRGRQQGAGRGSSADVTDRW